MQIIVLIFLLLIGIDLSPAQTSTWPGQPNWDCGFDGRRAKGYVQVLASDSLCGRYSGFAGSDKAERFIAEHFQKLGLLEPFGKDGYFQNFNYGAGEYTKPVIFVAHYPDGSLDSSYLWQEVNVFKYSGFGHIRGRLVFVGYGISAPDKSWDDYAGLDVKGAVVLAVRGAPQLQGVDWDKENMNGFKSTTALAKGAVGFLATETDPPKLATITERYYRPEMPAMWISRSLADTLLKSSGKTKDEWIKLIADSLKPVSCPLSVEIEMQVSGEYYPQRPICNVAGLLPGSDPKFASDLVIIGAHMDHHGVDAAGNIYHGADDNASGTAVVMELAEIFSKLEPKPKRSILFAGFAAEEEGLVGSRYMAQALKPDLPASRDTLPENLSSKLIDGYTPVAMFNMDMVGQGNGSVGLGGLNTNFFLSLLMLKEWPDSVLDQLEFWRLYDGSDHASFFDAGVPSFVVGARGEHPNYHTPNDTAGAIKPEVLKAVGDMMFYCARTTADASLTLSMFTGKSRMLLNEYGGSWFADPKVFKTRFAINNKLLKRIPIPRPILLVRIIPEEEKFHKPPLNTMLKNVEVLRRELDYFGEYLQVDSTLKTFTGEPGRGAIIVAEIEDIENLTSEALASLRRLGVGMVEVSVWDELKPVKLKKTALKFAPQIEASGLNLIGRFSDDKKAEIVAEVCHSTFYYVRSAPGVPEAESWRNLIRQEAFILLEPQDSEEFAVFVKSQISAAAFPNFCLYYDFRKLILLLDKLLKLEVKESTLSRLLLGNLQESLKQQNKFKITDGQ